MLVSWNWLQDFVDLDGLTPQELADTLTLAGLEVEGIERLGDTLDGIVVGRVDKVEPHPNADRLRICTVFDGTQELQIVCGAANVKQGMRAPLATIGTTMPSGMKIKKSKLRGETSEGMLCSASEVGREDTVDGLWELPEDAPVGEPIADALDLRDVVFDVSLTPNRGDCLSIRGIAREIAVLLDRPLHDRLPIAREAITVQTNGAPAAQSIHVEIQNPERCGRYCAAVVRNVHVGPSPQWMQRRLEAVGQRPLNNIVDVTNYLNIGYGQPTHAFDLDKLEGQRIIVRQAQKGETIRLLDDSEKKLTEDDLVIADEKTPIALAGVMGGAESAVDKNTKNVAFEIANFDAAGVRRSARRAHLHTDASHRFERGVDPTQIADIAERGIELFAAVQPEGHTLERAEGLVDVIHGTWTPKTLPLTLADLKRSIGIDYHVDEVHNALQGLGFEVSGDAEMSVTVPVRRPDIERTIDLVEEVGRVIGYDRLPLTLPSGQLGYVHTRREDAPVEQKAQPIVTNRTVDDLEALRTTLYSYGAFEAVNWGISDPDVNEQLTGHPPAVRLKNPLSSNLSAMRSTLLAGLLDNVKHNLARRATRVALFEIGQIFDDTFETEGERNMLAGVLGGERGKGWHTAGQKVDVWDITAWIVAISRALRRPISLHAIDDAAPPWVHPKASAAIVSKNTVLGYVGQIHPRVAKALDIDADVFAFELDSAQWLKIEPQNVTNVRVPRMVSADRDLAVVLDADITFARILESIASFTHPLFDGLRLFDVYRGSNLPEGKQSLAFRASYRHEHEALTDEQIDEAHQALTQHLQQAVGAERRG